MGDLLLAGLIIGAWTTFITANVLYQPGQRETSDDE